MLPEFGQIALILALGLSVLLSLIPLLGASKGRVAWMQFARPLVAGQFVFMAISFAILVNAFLQDDFTVTYVAQNSNTALPVYYKFSAVWGAHEGSLLLWVMILSGWTLAVSLKSQHLPLPLVARVLSVMGMIAVGFLLFVLLTSNPFLRYLPDSPTEGGDLNPLLQDIGLIVHPPMLYMGYVGFSVAFAFAIAALLEGRLDAAWARWSRPWTNLAWVFLTLGIILGSYWAYYELGWGGWWFWDPVENASFMPWLIGTALVHSLAVTDKRGAFKSWTVLLAIFAFSLSLLGTFLVRSGVLTSVHAFANDPARGIFILIFLLLVIGGSLTLYAVKAPAVTSRPLFSYWSREVLLLVNNLLLVIAAVSILLGTLYPLIYDALGLGRLSVGPPYFNAVFVPLMCLVFAALAFAPASQWRSTIQTSWLPYVLAGVASILLAILLPFLVGDFSIGAGLAALLAVWIVSASFRDLYAKWKMAGSFSGLKRLSLAFWGMHLAHVGLAVSIIGVAFTAAYTEQRDVRMTVGDTVELAGYRFELQDLSVQQGPNYTASVAHFGVFKGDRLLYQLDPQKRTYHAAGSTMTEAAIESGIFGDLYVALGETVDEGTWAVRVYYKAFVNWIWVGGLFMAAGGLLALLDRRYRVKSEVTVSNLVAGGAG